MRAAGQWFLMWVMAISLLGAFPGGAAQAAPEPRLGESAPLLQNLAVSMVSPPACPPGGCAAGQRLSMRFSFDPAGYDSAQNPNVKVCVYAPTSWNVSAASAAATGEVTGAPYTSRVLDQAQCAQNGPDPANYRLLLDQEAQLGSGAFADAVSFSFRLGADAAGSGVVLARLFIHDGTGWSTARSATGPTLMLTAAASPAYVANDLNTCGEYTPCYVNSSGDLLGGLGTGLKDAIDAIPSLGTVQVMGNYSIKTSTVVFTRPVIVTGMNDASITYNGLVSPATCASPMLALQSNVTLRGLNINDGGCASPNRGLIDIDSNETVLIESNDLNNGDNAIVISDNTGAVTVRFNEISGNSGYAVFAEGSADQGPLEITANNLGGNRSGPQVECGPDASGVLSYRRANHNHWGGGSPTGEDTHCSINVAKRMGMPIAHKTSGPGVDAQLVQVTENKAYAFGSQIAYQRTGGDNFPLYIANHGYATTGGPPFTYALGGESPSPCGNYFDVYLPPGVTHSGALELYFKYNKTSGCMATINSSQYCDQTSNMGKYPLFWYDPTGTNGVTKWWDYVGARPENLTSGDGQVTRCHMNLNEIQVSLDGSGRPGLNSDLGYTPFMVGVPILRSFLPLASSQTITVTWSTNNEPDVDGFFVWRSTDGANFTPISDRILHTGTALVGKSYYYIDPGRSNGVMYWYRLQILRTDGTSIYSSEVSVRANAATITPTPTRLPTWTATIIRPTNTRVFTRVPNAFPTRIATITPTLRRFLPTSTFLVLSTLTVGPQPGTPGALETPGPGEVVTGLPGMLETPGPGTGTPPTPDGSATPSPNALTATPAPVTSSGSASGGGPWLSLLLGLLSGLAAVGGLGGWWYYRLKH